MGLRSESPTVGRPPFPAGTPTVVRTPRPAGIPPRAAAAPAATRRRSALRGRGLRISSEPTPPAAGGPASAPAPLAADEPTPDRGRALLGKLIRRIEERRPR
jgi:hypothetical protein